MAGSYDELKVLEEKIAAESAFVETLKEELHKVLVGQDEMVEGILIGLICKGHVLLEGVPGLAKTLAISSLSKVINTGFQRIQFTPDLLPADLIGTLIYEQSKGAFSVKKGPVFTNLLLADEINRAPAKVQSALLEAMQERHVTIGSKTYNLPELFLVMATQNPIEQEGTYPLPEAQVDRFLLKLKVGYPNRDEERIIMKQQTTYNQPELQPVVEPEAIINAQKIVRDIYIDEKLNEYILDLVFATRNPEKYGIKELVGMIEFGASPRATIALALAARARAFLRHQGWVRPDDIKAVAHNVLRHRIILTYEAEAEELTADQVVTTLLERVEVP